MPQNVTPSFMAAHNPTLVENLEGIVSGLADNRHSFGPKGK